MTKMALDMEVGLSPGDFVLDGDPALPSPKRRGQIPNLWPNGWVDHGVTSFGGSPRPRRHCVRWRLPQKGGGSHHMSNVA